ncbi:hypothetical protein CPC08DRAFT_724783 [Agrocybe pediades]|nr:hypothetical protein CPC08DRAFT_724783 [Agrocybe pediades]
MSDPLSHHPHPSPPPLPPASAATRVRLSAEQALSRVSGLDEQKRARYGHRHSNSVGAFSPSAATSSSQQQKQISSPPSSSTASSSTSSLSFSSSSSSSTSHHHLPGPVHSPFSTLTHTPPSPRPRTPRTPLRSSTTPQYPHAVNTSPRPSPLFQRLLEPFAKTVGALTSSPTTTTTPSATPTNLSFSFLLPPFNNQDNSNMYSPPSPTYMHQQYTASRSERLLRDALMRDEMERNTGATASSSSSSSAISPHANAATSSASGSASASTSPRAHRRRHSHVPTSSTTPALNPNAHTSFASSGKLTASPTPLSPPLSTFSPSPNPNATAVAGPPSVAAATAGTHKDRKRRSLNTQASSLTKQQEEDLTRGSFLFRTAMSNPRSMSPSGASSPSGSASAGSASGSRSREGEGTSSRRSTSKSNESRVAYGGDREADVESLAVLPSTPLQRNGWRRQSVQATATAAGDEQELLLQHGTMHSRSRSAYTGGTASGPRSTSHSPSPLRRQQRPSSLQRQQRPSPLPLSNNNNNNPNNGHSTPDHNTAGPNTPNSASLQRHHTIHSSPSYRRNAGGAAASTTPETTPSKRPTRAGSRPPPIDLYNHHQQLNSPRRAQQLQSSSYHQTQGLNPASPGEPLIMTPHEQVLRARLERVLEAGKVVEKKEREKRRRSESRGATSGAAANEVRDEEGGWPWREKERGGRAGGVEVGDELPRMGHSRNRSKTDSALPSLSSSTSGLPPMPATPKRSTTAPAAPTTLSASKIPVLRRQQPRTGTTPPLEGGEDGDEDVEDGDLRLLTPPPTPPFTARIFGNGEYCPSPYKTSYSAGITGPARGNAKLGGLGGIRRPQNAPTMHNRQHQDMDDSHSSCSSSNSHSHGSQQHERRGRRHRSSSSASSSHENDLNTPPSPTPFSASAAAAAGHHRPQFNARKASARCRAIEGYVSFASVEGLGEPPADPLSPDGDDEEGDGRSGRKRDGRGMLLSMGTWSGWTRRLLGVGATGTGAGTVQREGGGQGEGVVL